MINVLLLPLAFVCFVGYFLNRHKLAIILFTIMTGCWLSLTIPTMQQELAGNVAISQMGIDQSAGSLEGKEMRFGTLASAFWCGVNVVIPAGTLTSMLDSYTPLSGVFMLLGMQVDDVSSAAGNGSGFERLGDNTPFWNLSTALVMLGGRFIPLIGPLAIAGILYEKRFIPPTSGVLPTESYTFGLLFIAIIVIIGALCFFPASAIGPIAEYLTQPR